jgi:hypothetical protein
LAAFELLPEPFAFGLQCDIVRAHGIDFGHVAILA